MVADPVGDLVEEGEAEVLVVELDIGLVGFCPGDCEAAALEGGLEGGVGSLLFLRVSFIRVVEQAYVDVHFEDFLMLGSCARALAGAGAGRPDSKSKSKSQKVMKRTINRFNDEETPED